MVELAPIVLFTYKRLDTLQQTVEALQQNYLALESDLHVFSDAAKGDRDKKAVDEVRKYIHSIDGFKSITIYESQLNKGLATSIIEGVSKVVDEYGKVIVLEDDILTSSGFLKYMNNALNFYSDKEEVMQISSFMFPIESNDLPDTFFYQANTCWGWGTWKRAWVNYNNDTDYLFSELKLRDISWEKFNSLQGKEFQKQLEKNRRGSLKTWAVKWHSAIKLYNGKVLHPKISYVANIGFSGNGENCGRGNIEGSINNQLDLDVSAAEKYSEKVALKRLEKYFKKRYSFYQKAKRKILGILTK